MTNLNIPGLADIGDVAAYMRAVGEAARDAARDVARADTHARNQALTAMAAAIRRDEAKLLAANAASWPAARGNRGDARCSRPMRATGRSSAPASRSPAA